MLEGAAVVAASAGAAPANVTGAATPTGSPIYTLTTVAGLVITALLWRWMTAADKQRDSRLVAIYLAGLAGGYLGAKFAFLFAEGWHHWGNWLALLSGHSITGALLGGVCGVEIAKAVSGYTRRTGDLFAVTVPVAIAIGRIGCMAAGCCPGVECGPEHQHAWWVVHDAAGHARWPAPAAELVFNAVFAAWALIAWRAGWQRGQRFNIYLMAYGVFRFAHEFLRDDVRWTTWLGGYHVVALATALVGAALYLQRQRAPQERLPA